MHDNPGYFCTNGPKFQVLKTLSCPETPLSIASWAVDSVLNPKEEAKAVEIEFSEVIRRSSLLITKENVLEK